MEQIDKGNDKKMTHFVFDVDGVFTTGQFLYTPDGKFAKVFGPHDHDGIKLVFELMDVCAISSDKRGWPITKKRIADDMGLRLELVAETERVEWFHKNFDLSETIYMGDGIYDAKVFEYVAYSIAPANAFYIARKKANFVTKSKSGEGAVAEACLHVMEKFFNQKV